MSQGLVARFARRRSTRITVDVAMVAILAVTPLTSERSFDPDFVLHSWAGMALVPLAGVHLAGNTAWLNRLRHRRLHARERSFSLVNVAIVGSLGLCIASGFPLWLEWVENTADEESIYESIHAISGLLGVGLTIAHLTMNRRRIVQLARRNKAAPHIDRVPAPAEESHGMTHDSTDLDDPMRRNTAR